MRKITLFSIFLLFYTTISAQISEGGLPPSFSNKNNSYLKTQIEPFTVRLEADVNRLKKEDEITDRNGAPSRVAIVIPAKVEMLQSGQWSTLANGDRICQFRLKAPDAQGIILSYSKFYIPQGAKLFIYNKERNQILGAYTSYTNPKGEAFSTEIVYGDELTLEYVASPNGEQGAIDILDIGYAYKKINHDLKVDIVEGPGFNQSGQCEVNINCPEGANWQQQKKGVVRSYSKITDSVTQALLGWFRCSGSIVNNVNEDRTPYYLSAYHCFFDGNGVTDFATAQFYFHYESSTCDMESQSIITERAKSIVGAQLLVASPIRSGSDGVLLKLDDVIPIEWNVYYNGWNREHRNNIVKDGAVIHHPLGDVKKISFFTDPLTIDTWDAGGIRSAENAHWEVRYSKGITEGGSSGSPIFDSNGLIVGTLTGGSSRCDNLKGADYYARFWYHWDQGENENWRMNKYLDPAATGVSQLSGWNGEFSEIELDKKDITVNIRGIDIVEVLRGNGGYTAVTSDSEIAQARLDGSTIYITGYNKGTAIITVKDKDNNSQIITVNVDGYNEDVPEMFASWISDTADRNTLSVTLKDDKDKIREIIIVDLKGNKIFYSSGFSKSEENINASAWPKGVYVLKIKTEKNKSRTIKVLK